MRLRNPTIRKQGEESQYTTVELRDAEEAVEQAQTILSDSENANLLFGGDPPEYLINGLGSALRILTEIERKIGGYT